MMTIKEIAQLAGVSTSTVSKIMNNKDGGISSETRENVLRIAKEYNYKPYSSFINSSNSKSLHLGIILRNANSTRYLGGGLFSLARDNGYSLIIQESSDCSELEFKNIMSFINMGVDGIIIETVSSDNRQIVDELEKANIPYIFCNNENFPEFTLNLYNASYFAANELIKHRHGLIACLASLSSIGMAFADGYKKCLFDNGISFNENLLFCRGDMDILISKLAAHGFTGIIISDYALAMQLFKRLDSLHYNIPQDISVIALKDEAHHVDYELPISTVTIPYYGFWEYLLLSLIQTLEKKDRTSLFSYSPRLDNSISIDTPYNLHNKKIISIGSINIDNYLNFKELPRTGKTAVTPSVVVYPGGKGLNEAVGAAKLGHNVVALGCVGNDSEADYLYEYAKGYNINCEGIRRCQNLQTGHAYIFVQEDGNSMISIVSGANNSLSAKDITDHEHIFKNAGFCLIQTEIPLEAVIQACKSAKAQNVITVIKPSGNSYPIDKLLQYTDILIPNWEELNDLCPDFSGMEEKVKQLHLAGVDTVIVTLGEKGCYISSPELICAIPAIDVVSVDSTGAGDAFICALVSYLLYGYSLLSAAKIATYAASLSTTRQGTTASLMDRASLEHYIRRFEPELLEKM